MQNQTESPFTSSSLLENAIKEAIDSINSSNIGNLRGIISSLNEFAFLEQDKTLITFSEIFYSVSKFIEKDHIRTNPKWPIYKQSLLNNFIQCLKFLHSNPIDLLSLNSLSLKMISDCDEISELLGRFHISTIEKAKVKIAADFYARGASLGTASMLTEADKSDLLNYIGATRIVDKYRTISVVSRLKSAEEFFLK